MTDLTQLTGPTRDDPLMPDGKRVVRFLYVNHRGKAGLRTVVPGYIYWGRTQWHPTYQWLLRGFDVDKNDNRDFALKDCNFQYCNFQIGAS